MGADAPVDTSQRFFRIPPPKPSCLWLETVLPFVLNDVGGEHSVLADRGVCSAIGDSRVTGTIAHIGAGPALSGGNASAPR